MTSRASLRLGIDIAAPADRVWAIATDWERQREWILRTEVYLTHGDGRSVDSRVAAFTGIGGIGFLDLIRIVEWDPPRRCVVSHEGRLVRGSGEFLVQAPGARAATFVMSEHLDLPLGWIGGVGWWLIRPFFVAGMRRSLDNLARLCRT